MFSKSLTWTTYEGAQMTTTASGDLYIAARAKDGFIELSKNGNVLPQSPFDNIEDAKGFAENQTSEASAPATFEARIDAFFNNMAI